MSTPFDLRNARQLAQDFVQRHRHRIWFFLILVLGIFARIWEFRSLPSGLHQDKASIGLDAYYLNFTSK